MKTYFQQFAVLSLLISLGMAALYPGPCSGDTIDQPVWLYQGWVPETEPIYPNATFPCVENFNGGTGSFNAIFSSICATSAINCWVNWNEAPVGWSTTPSCNTGAGWTQQTIESATYDFGDYTYDTASTLWNDTWWSTAGAFQASYYSYQIGQLLADGNFSLYVSDYNCGQWGSGTTTTSTPHNCYNALGLNSTGELGFYQVLYYVAVYINAWGVSIQNLECNQGYYWDTINGTDSDTYGGPCLTSAYSESLYYDIEEQFTIPFFSMVLGQDDRVSDYINMPNGGNGEPAYDMNNVKVQDWCTSTVNGVNVSNSVNMILTEANCSWTGVWLC